MTVICLNGNNVGPNLLQLKFYRVTDVSRHVFAV